MLLDHAARGGTLPVAGLAILAPWRGPLHNVGRIRDVARQVLAPATAGVAALSILGVTTLFVGGPHRSGPAVRLAPSQSAAATSAMPVAPGEPAPRAAVPPKTAAGTAGGGAGSHSGGNSGSLKTLLFGPKCAHTAKTRATSGTAGVNCGYNPTPPALVVRVPLPNNPTSLRYVGVTSDKVDCRKLPATPVARCVEQQHPSTSVSRSK